MPVFLRPDDYQSYREILRHRCERHGVAIWAYCLLPNHVHLIAAPDSEPGLARASGECHREYAVRIHRRQAWTSHLWQQRFYSCPLDERHLLAAARYVLQNPVRAGLVGEPLSWPWSSAQALLGLAEDPLVNREPLARLGTPWESLLFAASCADEVLALRQATRSGFWKEPPSEPRPQDLDPLQTVRREALATPLTG